MKTLFIIIICSISAVGQIVLPDINIETKKASVTSDDLQRVRNEVLAIFDMYESQVRLCQDAKEQIRVISLQEIDIHLQEIDRIRIAIQSQEMNIRQLTDLRDSLSVQLNQLKRRLRQVKRNRWVERTLTYSVIAYLTIKVL